VNIKTYQRIDERLDFQFKARKMEKSFDGIHLTPIHLNLPHSQPTAHRRVLNMISIHFTHRTLQKSGTIAIDSSNARRGCESCGMWAWGMGDVEVGGLDGKMAIRELESGAVMVR